MNRNTTSTIHRAIAMGIGILTGAMLLGACLVYPEAFGWHNFLSLVATVFLMATALWVLVIRDYDLLKLWPMWITIPVAAVCMLWWFSGFTVVLAVVVVLSLPALSIVHSPVDLFDRFFDRWLAPRLDDLERTRVHRVRALYSRHNIGDLAFRD